MTNKAFRDWWKISQADLKARPVMEMCWMAWQASKKEQDFQHPWFKLEEWFPRNQQVFEAKDEDEDVCLELLDWMEEWYQGQLDNEDIDVVDVWSGFNEWAKKHPRYDYMRPMLRSLWVEAIDAVADVSFGGDIEEDEEEEDD